MLGAVDLKLRRIQSGEPVRVLDLFSGCGGLSLGFHRAGAVSLGGVEIDPDAALSYAANFHTFDPEAEFAFHATPKDITRLQPRRFVEKLANQPPEAAVDVIVGGPPCPAFTRVGRAKLREVANHPEAFRHDPRATLYVPYLRFVRELQPLALLMENVPDILNFGGHNLGEEIAESLEGLGYECQYTLLNAANYGVPQMRERFFLVGIHKSVGKNFEFPAKTHDVDFPPGYNGSRRVALKVVGEQFDDLFEGPARTRYVPSPAPSSTMHPPITARDAIQDLPPLTDHLEGREQRGARRFITGVEYLGEGSDYAREMRKWVGFKTDGAVFDHVTRSLSDRDYRLFRKMKPGDDYPRAYELAVSLFAEKLADLRRRRIAPSEGSGEFLALQRQFIPPYAVGKFPNKWRKIEPDLPVRTLMAHLGKDGYSHIHYDSVQARVISVREAARLQSFPDGFVFAGTMNPAFRQIGNSVPPLLSYCLARSILGTLGAIRRVHAKTPLGSLDRRRRLALGPHAKNLKIA